METLVLDSSYQPVDKVPWQRAITLYFQGKVEIVEEYSNQDLRSVTFAIKMPSVVRFFKALRGKRKVVKFSRENVYTRDKGRCQYCGNAVARAEFTYDHVLPRSQGGKTEWTNIVCSCVPCNQKKQNRTPEKAGMRLHNVPVKPKKLPETVHLTFTWREGMPDTWRSWLRDAVRDMTYWHGELDQE